jgi:hypothetical protein
MSAASTSVSAICGQWQFNDVSINPIFMGCSVFLFVRYVSMTTYKFNCFQETNGWLELARNARTCMYLEDQRDAVLNSLYLFTSMFVHGLFLIGFYSYISKFMTCTSGCNYSLCTPDDGCGRQPKHVEWLGSKTNKDCLELHLFGLLTT